MAVTPRRLGLTRDQFASFLQDFEQIKQFENLFATVDEINNVTVDEINIAAGNANASANEALSQIDVISQIVEQIALAPRNELGTMSELQQANVPWMTFNTIPPLTPTAVGSLYWNGGTTLNVQMTPNVIQRVGEDLFYYIKASATITKGQVIMFDGAVGTSGVLKGKPATGVTSGYYIMGIAAESIANNDFGLVQINGPLKGIDTSMFADGDVLWYDPTVVGGLTATVPAAPNVKVEMAAVARASNNGVILIRVTAGSTLGETDTNVQFTGLADADIIEYNAALGYWENTPATSVQVVSWLGL